MTGFSTKTSILVVKRDVGRCVVCGGRGAEKHHRRRRRVDFDGLAHVAANGALMCGWGNHSGCHGRVHSDPLWARERGYILRPDESPLLVPLLHFSRGWVLLDAEGGWASVPVGGAGPVQLVPPADG